MTIETTVASVEVNGNGSATVFSFNPMTIEEPADGADHDLVVTKVLIATGVGETLAEGSSSTTYSVSVAAYPGTGSITFPASGGSPLASGYKLVIKRQVEISQTTDLDNRGGYFADTQERMHDKHTMVDLQQQEILDRCVKVPIGGTDTPEDFYQSLLDTEANAAASATAAAGSATAAQTAETNAAASAAAISIPLLVSSGGTGATTSGGARTALGLGSAAVLDVGTSAGEVVQLDVSGKLPAVDGSQLTNVGGGSATVTAGENLADRDLVYQDIFNQRAGGVTKWYKVGTDAVGPVRIGPRLGIALAAITSGATGLVQIRAGRVSGFSGLTAGAAVFASTTAGAVTQTEPPLPATGTQNALRLIGIAASATEIDFAPEDTTLFVKTNDALANGSSVTVEHWTDAGAPDRVPFASALGSSWTSTASRSNGSNATGYTTYGSRIKIAASASSTSGTGVRLTLRGDSGGFTFNDCYIGEAAAAGNAWDFAATPTRVTFNTGSNGATISANSDLVSDQITFTFDETKNYIVAINCGGANADTVSNGSAPSGWTGYTKPGGNTEASSTAPSGYSAIEVLGLKAIEVVSATRREPEALFPEGRFSGATDKITCRYDDGAGSSPDTKTTFINRTSALQALAAEVVL